MMNIIVKQVRALYEQELYSNVIRVCELTLTLCEQKPEVLTIPAKVQVLFWYGDSLYQTQQFVQAEHTYRQALHIRLNYKIKTKHGNNTQSEMVSDVDIRYKIYQCCMALKQTTPAAEILQEISIRSRTPKINMALGNLFKEFALDRSAIICYKEVLKECPMALEAVDNLLKLGIQGVEVNSLIVEVSSEVSWFNCWLKAQAQMYSRDFASAVTTYKSMDQHGILLDNPSLLVAMAYCYHYMCEDDKAIAVFQRVFQTDPRYTTGRDLYTTILANSANKQHIKTLESLAPTTDMTLWTYEHWIALGNYMYAIKNYEKAAYFAQQAYILNRRNVEALLLKSNIYFQFKKYQEAVSHCSEAIVFCNYRFDLYKCLVESLLQLNRVIEAESIAQNAVKQLNNSPHALCLLVTVLLKDQMTSSKNIRKYLEKACAQDPNMQTNALDMLVELLQQEQQYEQASQLLLKHIDQHPTARLHQLLADCLMFLHMDNEAFDHYTTALRLDPTNQRATEGLNNIGRSVSTNNKRDSYFSCGDTSYNSQGTNSSDHEADMESDTDPWPIGEAPLAFD